MFEKDLKDPMHHRIELNKLTDQLPNARFEKSVAGHNVEMGKPATAVHQIVGLLQDNRLKKVSDEEGWRMWPQKPCMC